MRDRIQVILICILIPLGALYWYTNNQDISVREIFLPGTKTMHIADFTLRVDIANSLEERMKGLSGRENLGKNIDGVLFVFDETAYHNIWMKDMKFPIDIIWISEDLKVINVEKNISPDTYPLKFRPDQPARYAIETNTHYSDTFGVRAGMTVKLPLKYLED